jgi:S1-C subfamily serine protease
MATAVREVEELVRSIAATAGPAVVGVGRRRGLGSGVIIHQGRVLTNAHNVRGEKVTVTFEDGRTEEAAVAGIDLDGDLAVLNVDTASAPAIEWSEGVDGLDLGSAVGALSNPGGRGLRVTWGLVSGTNRSFRGPRGRRIAGTIEHTAPLLPGSSGGPLVDRSGRLLGINTNRLGEGFYLAIPAGDELRRRVDDLGRGEAPRRARLGVGLAPAHVARRLRRAVGLPERDGLLVRGVEEGSPADRAGIKEGDLIVGAGGREVTDFDELVEALDDGDDAIELKLVRGTEDLDVSVALARTE